MKGESVFAADIGTEQPKDNVVCESRSPWVLSAFHYSFRLPLKVAVLLLSSQQSFQ